MVSHFFKQNLLKNREKLFKINWIECLRKFFPSPAPVFGIFKARKGLFLWAKYSVWSVFENAKEKAPAA